MDNLWILPIWTTIACWGGWVMRSRVSEPSIVTASSFGEDERAAEAFKRLDAFNKVAEKFVKEVKEKISRKFGDQNEDGSRPTLVDCVLERVQRLEELLKQNMSFSEEHLNAFRSIWRDTLTLGVKLSQELKALKARVTGLDETIETQGRRITGQQSKIDAQQSKIDALATTNETQQSKIDALATTNETQKTTNETLKSRMDGLAKEVEELGNENTRVKNRADKLEGLSEKLRYSEWISRMNELSASLLDMSWDDLGKTLKSEHESHPRNPWVVEGSMHKELYEKVLKSKLSLDTSIWDSSRSYQGQRNRDVHNKNIRDSQGDLLRYLLVEDFQNLEFSSFTWAQKEMLGEVLRVLYGHYFEGSIDNPD